MNLVKIFIGGDFVPTESNRQLFKQSKMNELFGDELWNLMKSADFRVFNLEAPVTDCSERLAKAGPNLKISPDVMPGLCKMMPVAFSMANNHILDYKEIGLNDTIKHLNRANIRHFGAKNSLEDIKSALKIILDDNRIAVYSCTENEFSAATDSSAGANPYDPLYVFDDVENLKKTNDIVIVLFHGGREQYKYPLVEQQKRCRHFIDKGADIVLMQHSHCIGCEEIYNGRVILYGQGNFLFDLCEHPDWQNGLGLMLSIEDRKIKDIDYCVTQKNNERLIAATAETKNRIINDFRSRSEEIKAEGFILKKQVQLSEKVAPALMRDLRGAGLVYKALDKLTKNYVTDSIYSRKCLDAYDCMRCETHKELIDTYLSLKRSK